MDSKKLFVADVDCLTQDEIDALSKPELGGRIQFMATPMSFAEMVEEFHRRVLKYGPKEKGVLTKEEFDQHWRCYCEELKEMSDAYHDNDFIGTIDAVIDLMYFAMGALTKMGLTYSEINRCITAVHEANMEKKLGVVARRGDGTVPDAIKPDGWIPAEERIAKILGVINGNY